MKCFHSFFKSGFVAQWLQNTGSLSITKAHVDEVLHRMKFTANPFEEQIHPQQTFETMIVFGEGEDRFRESLN